MAQSSANDSDNNEASDISSQLSEIRENYEKKINELQSELSQLKNLLMAVISKSDENNLPSSSQSSSKPAHIVGLDKRILAECEWLGAYHSTLPQQQHWTFHIWEVVQFRHGSLERGFKNW